MTPRARATNGTAVTAAQVAAFRLDRHHLAARKRAPIESICREVCGVQAQVMSAAELALWARWPGLDRADVHDALVRRRTLVKTSCMRITLHLIPSDEHGLYVAALRRSRTAAIARILARLRVGPTT